MTGTIVHPIAAISFNDKDPVDLVLERVAARLKSNGLVVEGFLQRETDKGEGCCATMHLALIADGSTTTISQQLGKLSKGCRLDPQALAELSGPLTARLDGGADLLIINRFGKGETQGGGFRSAIAHAAALGIPVLTAVRGTYWQAWKDFAGADFTELNPVAGEIENWARTVVGRVRLGNRAA